MKQLELFDYVSSIEFALSLTGNQVSDLKHRDKNSYAWVKAIRETVNRKISSLRAIENQYNPKIQALAENHPRYVLDDYGHYRR